MDAFYERILSPDHNGAAFFAVCRGKVTTTEHTLVHQLYSNYQIMFDISVSRSAKVWTLLI